MLQVGQATPLFNLEAYTEGEFKNISLTDYKGKWVVLFFYPLDFTFVCPTEIKSFAKQAAEFAAASTSILACSTDSVHSHKAWVEQGLGTINYPMLSDITKEVSRAYGILEEAKGIALRGTFIIDPEGILRYTVISDLNVGRSVTETLRVVKALQTGELCPVEWVSGVPTLGKA